MIEKIVSGGQTGADRAALDFAISHGIAHGGWAPKGRIAEDGVIASRYQLEKTETGDPAERTGRNVHDSDGTVIFTIAPDLSGGCKTTAEFAQRHGKPLLHLHPEQQEPCARQLRQFLSWHNIRVLNVAGSRLSQEPGIYDFVRKTLAELLHQPS